MWVRWATARRPGSRTAGLSGGQPPAGEAVGAQQSCQERAGRGGAGFGEGKQDGQAVTRAFQGVAMTGESFPLQTVCSLTSAHGHSPNEQRFRCESSVSTSRQGEQRGAGPAYKQGRAQPCQGAQTSQGVGVGGCGWDIGAGYRIQGCETGLGHSWDADRQRWAPSGQLCGRGRGWRWPSWECLRCREPVDDEAGRRAHGQDRAPSTGCTRELGK